MEEIEQSLKKEMMGQNRRVGMRILEVTNLSKSIHLMVLSLRTTPKILNNLMKKKCPLKILITPSRSLFQTIQRQKTLFLKSLSLKILVLMRVLRSYLPSPPLSPPLTTYQATNTT